MWLFTDPSIRFSIKEGRELQNRSFHKILGLLLFAFVYHEKVDMTVIGMILFEYV
jgi:hypothetical protein